METQGSTPGSTITSPPPTTSYPAPSPSYNGRSEEAEAEPIRSVIHPSLLKTPPFLSPPLPSTYSIILSKTFSLSITDNGAHAETKKSSSAPNYPPRKKKGQLHQPRNGRTISTRVITGKRINPLRGPARRQKRILLIVRIPPLAVLVGNV